MSIDDSRAVLIRRVARAAVPPPLPPTNHLVTTGALPLHVNGTVIADVELAAAPQAEQCAVLR